MATTTTNRDRLEVPIQGMTCASCASRVERSLNALDGVSATVNFATERATVDLEPGGARPDDLTRAVERAGYRAMPPRPATEAPAAHGEEDAAAPLLRRLAVSAALTVPVLCLSMIPALQSGDWRWVALVLATPVVVWGAWPFHRAAWANARHGARWTR
jgi:P-type Cu+ transporter